MGVKYDNSNIDENHLKSAQKNLLEEFKRTNSSGEEIDDLNEEALAHKLYERPALGLGKEVSFFPFDLDQRNSLNSQSELFKPLVQNNQI